MSDEKAGDRDRVMPSSAKNSSGSLGRMICVLGAVFLLGFFSARFFPVTERNESFVVGRSGTPHMRQQEQPGSSTGDSAAEPFILSIEMKFRSEEGVKHFQRLFTEMAQWVRSNELSTTSYSFSSSDKDPLQALVFEQYVDYNAYIEVHKTSSRFLEFKKSIMKMNEGDVVARLGWKMLGESYRHKAGFV